MFVFQILNTMETIEKTGKCGLDKRRIVLEILEELITKQYGHEVWRTKYREFAEEMIDFIIEISKGEVTIDINNVAKRLFPCC